MQTQCTFALLRYVPDAVKNEFVNVGLVLLPQTGKPELRFTRDWSRVRCLDPQADLELLEQLESDLSQKLHDLNGDRDFILRRMQDSFSNALQPTEFTACLAESPTAEADALARMYLERPQRRAARETGGRQAILQQMRAEFERVGAWPAMRREIQASDYTSAGDPLKIDCGYGADGTVKLFQAVALQSDVNSAKVLAFSFPRLAEGIRRNEGKRSLLTAIVEDNLPQDSDAVHFARETMEQQQIRIAPLAQIASIADTAAREMGLG